MIFFDMFQPNRDRVNIVYCGFLADCFKEFCIPFSCCWKSSSVLVAECSNRRFDYLWYMQIIGWSHVTFLCGALHSKNITTLISSIYCKYSLEFRLFVFFSSLQFTSRERDVMHCICEVLNDRKEITRMVGDKNVRYNVSQSFSSNWNCLRLISRFGDVADIP